MYETELKYTYIWDSFFKGIASRLVSHEGLIPINHLWEINSQTQSEFYMYWELTMCPALF